MVERNNALQTLNYKIMVCSWERFGNDHDVFVCRGSATL